MNRIPLDKNKRAKDMWKIISDSDVQFEGKQVVDLGCGGGEMLWRASQAGASHSLGLDRVFGFELMDVVGAFENVEYTNKYNLKDLYQRDVNLDEELGKKFDIAICFSVMPYINYRWMLSWMARSFPISLIEAQYIPEPYSIDVYDDEEMRELLKNSGFSDVKMIGKTYIDYREVYRSIWVCKP